MNLTFLLNPRFQTRADKGQNFKKYKGQIAVALVISFVDCLYWMFEKHDNRV